MKKYKIAVLRGDGIGPEVVDQAINALDKAAKEFGFTLEYTDALIGGIAIDSAGTPLPDETVSICKACDAVLLGAVGGAKWDDLSGDMRPESGLLGIRSRLGLFANLRPAMIFDSLKDASPLKASGGAMDIMVVRELTGGIYFGERGHGECNGERYAFDTERYTESEIERIVRVGFKLAAGRRGRLCSVDKANVLDSSRLWRKIVNELALQYPQVEVSHLYVDNCAMQLVRDPAQFDVLVTSNMFGDILSDEASMITGSLGMLPSASLAGGSFGLYEPVHGSAPDIAGTGKANPCAAILSAAMLLRWSLGEDAAACAIENAVDRALKSHRTPDIFADGCEMCSCEQMGGVICEFIVAN